MGNNLTRAVSTMRAKPGPSLWDSQEFSVSPLILISGGHMALTQRWVFSFFWGPGEGELLHFLSLACSTNSQASFPCMFLVQPCVLWSQFTLTNLEGGILSAFRNNVSLSLRLVDESGQMASFTCLSGFAGILHSAKWSQTLLGRWSPSGKVGKTTVLRNAEKLWAERTTISTQNAFSRDTKSTLV